MKKLILLATILFSAFTSSAQISDVTDIDDLALIYIGAQHRPDWTKELFYPYVVHEYADGAKSWMFDGFLMIEFMKWNEQNVPVTFGEYNAQAALKTDWEALLDEQLGTKTGFGCKALDELIGEMIPILGQPGHKHKVVLTMPSAETTAGNTWGEVNGKQLNFNVFNDRVTAHKWYIDRIREKWNAAGFKNIELDGIYWVKEAMGTDVRETLKAANIYAHQKRLKVYWIPYFTASGRFDWKEMGMDVAYLQPNYFFRNTTPKEQLDQAIIDAYENNLGLEMEFEGYNFSWSAATGRKRLTPANCGLYGISPEFYQRFVDYIDYYEKEDVFTWMPLAYYSGFQGVFDFMNSGHPKDRELIDRLAILMNTRHVSTGWDTEPSFAGIDEITANGCSEAYAVEGGIYVADNAGADVSICTPDGRVVYTRAKSGERLAYGEVFACSRGVYVVRIGQRTVKVAVR